MQFVSNTRGSWNRLLIMFGFVRWELHFQWFTYLELQSCLWDADSPILTSRNSTSSPLWRRSLNERMKLNYFSFGRETLLFTCDLSWMFSVCKLLDDPCYSYYSVGQTMWLWLWMQFGLFILESFLPPFIYFGKLNISQYIKMFFCLFHLWFLRAYI